VVGPENLGQLDECLGRYAAFGALRHVRTWLAYMPCKQRVLQDWLEFAPDAPPAIVQWRPTDLPARIGELCQRHGIGFIDLTPALVESVRQTGEPPFNLLYDTHLNAQGAEAVALELARRLGAGESAGARPPAPPK
jgi:hypothetical protein